MPASQMGQATILVNWRDIDPPIGEAMVVHILDMNAVRFCEAWQSNAL